MKMWIDCEFNEFGGELISMALVDEKGEEWYEVLDVAHPTDWVKKNVLPVLNREPVSREVFQKGLQNFLNQHEDVEIIGDWPEDLSHFCQSLITGRGRAMSTPPLSLTLRQGLFPISKQQHNALADARALRTADRVAAADQA